MPYFDGTRTGDFVYFETVDGMPAEITSTASFNVSSTVGGPHYYEFEGTVELLGQTYNVSGFETLPEQVELRPQVASIESHIRIEVQDDEKQVYTLCGSYFYGVSGFYNDFGDNRGVTLSLLAGRAEEFCHSFGPHDEEVLGTIYLPADRGF